MKVRKLIERLQKLDSESTVWVSSNGIDYEVVDYVDVDDENDVLILGKIKRNY